MALLITSQGCSSAEALHTSQDKKYSSARRAKRARKTVLSCNGVAIIFVVLCKGRACTLSIGCDISVNQ
jgi:hypothetical protein